MVESLLMVGGMIGSFVGLPLDFMKTQMQIQNYKQRHSIISPFIGAEVAFFKSALKLSINSFLFSYFTKENKISLVVSSSVVTCLLTPLDHVLVKLQTTVLDKEANSMYNIYHGFKYIVKRNGKKDLFRGLDANLLKNFSFLATSIITDTVVLPYHNTFWKLSVLMIAQIPMIAVSHPFDVIKTHLQKCERIGDKRYAGFIECLTDLYNKFGIQGFYRGVIYAYMKNSLSLAISITLFGYLRKD